MFFGDLQRNLLDALRARIRNGEITERGLARLTGVSQPHIHNVLKGVRILSLDLADRILADLHLSVTDFMYCSKSRVDPVRYEEEQQFAHLPVLEGKIGPRNLWPTTANSYERFAIRVQTLAHMTAPIAVRLGRDPQMETLFSEGDYSLLDQAYLSRTCIEPDAYYAVKRGYFGCIRRVRLTPRKLFLLSEEQLESPELWESIDLSGRRIEHFVRARVTFMTRDIEWKASVG